MRRANGNRYSSFSSVGFIWWLCFTAACSGVTAASATTVDGAASKRRRSLTTNNVSSNVNNSSLLPEVLRTTLIVDLNPLEEPFNPALVSEFVQSLTYFFQLIFQAQTEYSIAVQSMDVSNQHVSLDQTLSLTTNVACVFQPQSSDQALSHQDLEHILIHVINRYQAHLVKYMHRQQSDFATIETAFGHALAYSSSSSSSPTRGGSSRHIGLIVGMVVAGVLLVVSLSASWVLYRRQARNLDDRNSMPMFRRFRRQGQIAPFDSTERNLSPFHGDDDDDKAETVLSQGPSASYDETAVRADRQSSMQRSGLMRTDDEPRPSARHHHHNHDDDDNEDEEDGVMETIEFGCFSREPRVTKSSKRTPSNPLSFSRPSSKEKKACPVSPLLTLDMPSLSPARGKGLRLPAEDVEGGDTSVLLQQSRLSLDETMLFFPSDNSNNIETPVGSRFEIYAPPGKLGVAIDTVNGQPVVYRVKPGSPLHGFLRKMDRIIAIDGVDTTRMSAADVTNLMVKNMSKRRKITYVRGDAVFT